VCVCVCVGVWVQGCQRVFSIINRAFREFMIKSSKLVYTHYFFPNLF